jgi:hypothetical protein
MNREDRFSVNRSFKPLMYFLKERMKKFLFRDYIHHAFSSSQGSNFLSMRKAYNP